jgi:hypothetical protein
MALSRPRRTGVGLAALLALVAPAVGSAQATGTITGLVTDSTGSVLPMVSLDVRNGATGIVRHATTSHDGVYVVPLLPPGVYMVSATLAGFSVAVRTGVHVSVSENARIDFSLSVGPITREVTV